MNSDEMNVTIKKVLDERENSIPAHVQSALTQARYSAVNTERLARHRSPSWLWRGAATLASITLAVVLWQPMLPSSVTEGAVFDDIELLASEEDLGFYDDLEFIAWVDEMEQSG